MSLPEKSIALHMCYVHGWQGDHTSFQAFPTDLHNYLVPRLPAGIKLNTHIYPTYKAVRPIEEATQKLLKWLETLAEGRIILMGHSLGGFLTADAAVGGKVLATLRRRIIGMIAFDVPFLGIHPHVVISGLASILPACGPKESDVNDHNKVNIVDDSAEQSSFIASRPDLPPVDGQQSLLRKAERFWAKHGNNPIKFTMMYLTEFLQFGSCVVDRKGLSDRYLALEQWGNPAKTTDGGDWIHFFTITNPKNDSSDAPSSTKDASSDNSSHVFDPPLNDRKAEAPATVGEIGVEINPYGTDRGQEEHTIAKGSTSEFDRAMETARKEKADWEAQKAAKAAARRSAKERGRRHHHPHLKAFARSVVGGTRSQSNLTVDALPSPKSETSSLSSVGSSDVSDNDNERPKSPDGGSSLPPTKKPHRHAPQHFIVLPWVMGNRWQGIPIGGVEDEVQAHTGIFFRNKNFEYEGIIERTANFTIQVAK